MNIIPFRHRIDSTTYTGRNGVGQCTGIDILVTANHLVLSPVNSKGQVANCEINIPLEDLSAVVRALYHAIPTSFPLVTPKEEYLKAPKVFYYSINMHGRSAFMCSTIEVDTDLDEDTSDLVADAIKREVIDSDDAKDIFNISAISKEEYLKAVKA